jgi:hypothetical protein
MLTHANIIAGGMYFDDSFLFHVMLTFFGNLDV